jgi:hypothetical protein
MSRIVLNVLDERKVGPLRVLLNDLSYIRLQDDEDGDLKMWDGSLKVLDSPVTVGDFKIYSRDELHER